MRGTGERLSAEGAVGILAYGRRYVTYDERGKWRVTRVPFPGKRDKGDGGRPGKELRRLSILGSDVYFHHWLWVGRGAAFAFLKANVVNLMRQRGPSDR